MKQITYLFLLFVFFACAKEAIVPLEQQGTFYYLLVKVDDAASTDAIHSEVIKIAHGAGGYRSTRLFLREDEAPVIVIRRFTSERKANKLMRRLAKNERLAKLEMKSISQPNFRKMIKQRTFYPD